MDFEFSFTDMQQQPQPQSQPQPGHHKKHSTFANVPYADTNGLDDFFGFGVEETQLHQQLKEYKAIIDENQDIIDSKDALINELKTENAQLKQTIISLETQLQHSKNNNNKQKRRKNSNSSAGSSSTTTIPPHEDDIQHYSIVNSNVKAAKINIPSILRPSPQSQTTAGSALFSKTKNNGGGASPFNTQLQHTNQDVKHSISPSLNNFLDKLDFKFKEDEENGVPNGVDSVAAIKRSPALLSSNSDNLNSNDEKDNDEYIYNPTASILMDIDGHLPQLRRSSLSEEEQERMEQEAMMSTSNDNLHSATKKNKNNNNNGGINEEIGNRDKSNSFNNVIFKDSNVKNMNMNIINHHQHNHSKSRVDTLKKEIEDLKQELENMRKSKIQLIINTNDEINNLRTIIRQYLK